jgi:hypothetical protein
MFKVNLSTQKGALGPTQLGMDGTWGQQGSERLAPTPAQGSPTLVGLGTVEANTEEKAAMQAMRRETANCQLDAYAKVTGKHERRSRVDFPDIYFLPRHLSEGELEQLRAYTRQLHDDCVQAMSGTGKMQ